MIAIFGGGKCPEADVGGGGGGGQKSYIYDADTWCTGVPRPPSAPTHPACRQRQQNKALLASSWLQGSLSVSRPCLSPSLSSLAAIKHCSSSLCELTRSFIDPRAAVIGYHDMQARPAPRYRTPSFAVIALLGTPVLSLTKAFFELAYVSLPVVLHKPTRRG